MTSKPQDDLRFTGLPEGSLIYRGFVFNGKVVDFSFHGTLLRAEMASLIEKGLPCEVTVSGYGPIRGRVVLKEGGIVGVEFRDNDTSLQNSIANLAKNLAMDTHLLERNIWAMLRTTHQKID